MKTTRIGEATDKVTELETVKMSIDASAIDSLMSNLTNLYSNPTTAILREYTSNAIDSHVRAGVTIPVEVTTPAITGDKLIVQDFGIGMSKDDIANVYSRYGLSTKGNSNDEIGGFGLGCKSALAVADRFDITAIKDGVKTIAFVEKNVKGVGVVHFVSEEATEDGNGVTITIPMPSNYNTRSHFTKEAIASFFLGMKGSTLSVDGNMVNTIDNAPWATIEAGGVRVGAYYNRKVDYGSVEYAYNTVSVTCGGVLYDATGLANETDSKDFAVNAQRYNMKIVLDAPIGSVDLTPSRESLMLTDRTRATISALLSDVRQGVAEMFLTNVVNSKTIEEAVGAFVDATQKGYWEQEVSYRGTVIPRMVEVSTMAYVFSKPKKSAGNVSEVNHVRRITVEHLVANGVALPVFAIDDSKTAETVDALRKNLAYFHASKGSSADKYGYAFLKSEIATSSFLTHLAKNAVDIDQMVAVSTVFKSEKRKASLAATKAAKASGIVAKAGVTLPVYDIATKGRVVKPVEVLSLAGQKVAYIDSRDGHNLLRSFPTIGWQYNNGGVKLYTGYRNGGVRMLELALSDYQLVFITANRKVESVLKLIPQAVPAVPLIEKFVADLVATKRDELAKTLIQVNHPHVVREIAELSAFLTKEGVVGNIADVETAKMIVEAGVTVEVDEEMVFGINNWAKDDALNSIVAGYITKVQAFTEKYPLAFTARLADEKVASHLVGYINMVDAI